MVAPLYLAVAMPWLVATNANLEEAPTLAGAHRPTLAEALLELVEPARGSRQDQQIGLRMAPARAAAGREIPDREAAPMVQQVPAAALRATAPKKPEVVAMKDLLGWAASKALQLRAEAV